MNGLPRPVKLPGQSFEDSIASICLAVLQRILGVILVPGLAEILERFEDTPRRHTAQLESFPAEQWAGSASYASAAIASVER
jgi:hypothetical protein